MADPKRDTVLAWLFALPTRKAVDAARHFWPELTGEELKSRAAVVRTWSHRARLETRQDTPTAPVPSRVVDPALVAPEGASERERELLSELAAVPRDVESARTAKAFGAIPGLLKSGRELRQELDLLRSAPPPDERRGAARPLLSNDQLKSLSSEQLGALISGFALGARDDRQLTEDEVAAGVASVLEQSPAPPPAGPAVAPRRAEGPAAVVLAKPVAVEPVKSATVDDPPVGQVPGAPKKRAHVEFDVFGRVVKR